MVATINASVSSSGVVTSADASGILKVQSNGVATNALAWARYNYVNNGTIPSLASSYNVSSLTRSSSGVFTMAFTNALADANYCAVGMGTYGAGTQSAILNPGTISTASIVIQTGYVSATSGAVTAYDFGFNIAIFGN